MEPSKPTPTLDFTRQEAIQDMKNRLSDPSASGKTMRNRLRDGTLDRMELSNGRVQTISPERFPELYEWFREQEIAMGILKPSPDKKVATMTPKEWGGVSEGHNKLGTEKLPATDEPIEPASKPARK